MSTIRQFGFALAFALSFGVAAAEPHGDAGHGGPAHGEARGGEEHGDRHDAEPHPGPRGYQRVGEPQGWNNRPATVDRGAYQHNFQAARTYHVGAFRAPRGWHPHHWVYGQTLPRAYWAPQYLLADYWLFALEVPPVGFEWVRDDADALLINVSTGEILEVEYGVFG